MTEMVTPPDLVCVRRWAQSKIDAGSEPPWAWYQYMKLIDAIQAIEAGQAATASNDDTFKVELPI